MAASPAGLLGWTPSFECTGGASEDASEVADGIAMPLCGRSGREFVSEVAGMMSQHVVSEKRRRRFLYRSRAIKKLHRSPPAPPILHQP